MKFCSWCSLEFEPKVKYQIYCSKECRDLSTKEKINERYNKNRREKLIKKKKKCSGGCGTFISIYNKDDFCHTCSVNKKQVDKMLKELKGLFGYEQNR
jgi:hypothetical protein